MTTATSGQRPSELGALIDQAPLSRFQIRVVVLCALGAFFDGYDIQAMGLAAPSVAHDFGTASASLGPALSAALVGMALGSVTLGPLADRLGRRPVMIGLMLLIGCTALATATAQTLWHLAGWRLLTGLGLGGLVPVATSLTAEYSPRARRTALITLMICCISLGSLASSVIAPALDARFGWRGIFIVGGIMPLLTACLYWAALPESLRRMVEHDPGNPRIAAQLRAIVPTGDLPKVHVAATHHIPQTARMLLSRLYFPRTLLLWTVWSLNLFVNFSLASWLPTLLQSAGWAHASALRAVALMALGGLAGGIALSWLADRGRIVGPLMAAYLIAATALLGFGVLAPDHWGMLIVAAGLGAFGAQLTIGALAAAFYPFEIRSTGLGWASGIGRLGSIAGPLALGVMLGQGLSSSAVLAVLALPIIACAACVLLLPQFLGER